MWEDSAMSDEKLSVWILGDQLLAQHPALAEALKTHPKDRVRIVLVESAGRSRRFPYQRKKLVLLFSAMRHYVAHLRQKGHDVDYIQAPTFLDGLRQHIATWQPARFFANRYFRCTPIPVFPMKPQMFG